MTGLLASGRNAHRLLIANSSRRRHRDSAAALLLSISSQTSSNCSVSGLEEQHNLQGQTNRFGAPEEVLSPFSGPSSSSDDSDSQSFTRRAPDLNSDNYFQAEASHGSSDKRFSLWPNLWMSASITDQTGNQPSVKVPRVESLFALSWGPRQNILPASEFGLQQDPQIEVCQEHVNDFFRVLIWQRTRALDMGHSHLNRGGRRNEKPEKITRDWRNSSPTPRQVRGLSLFSSSWGSRQCLHCSKGSASQQERKVETYQGRRHVKELSRLQIWYFPRRFHMGHAHHHHEGGGHDKSGKASERVLGWGLWSDVGLAIVKGGSGYLSGSTALIADAAHSVSDIALSAVALWTSKVAHAPKDNQHPYGHGKFESVGALGISGMLLLTGGGIAWHALESLMPYIPMISEWLQTTTGHSHDVVHGDGHHHDIDLQHPYLALTAAVVSIGVKEILYQRTKRIGDEQHSELLKASAWHHRSDAISSVVALLGVGGAILGLRLLDPVAGFVVSGMIMKAGFGTGYQSLQDLVDSAVPQPVLAPIRDTVLKVEGVEGCHHLRGRRMGSFIHLDAHIEVDPWLSVSAAHNIAEAVRHQVHKKHPEVTETFVHIEPADGRTKILADQEAEVELESLDHHKGDLHRFPDKNEYSIDSKDLTNLGSKSDLMESSHKEACVDDDFENDMRQHSGIEQDVRNVVGTNFHEKMSINQVTSHFLQGKVVVEVEVSMNPEISVRNAMNYADDAQRAILERVSDISSVRVQLKLTSKSPTQTL